MPRVALKSKLTNNDLAGMCDKLTPLQMNLILALMTGGANTINDLIDRVRTSNPVSYRFVNDGAFYKAVAQLQTKGYLTYG